MLTVDRQERASHPVGTTVKVTDFFNGLPVRRQTALKDATKCLGRIKRLLQAYALARPAVRFSLKVLKAKNDKGNWMYAPKPGAGIEDAALKVAGKDCASQCAWSVVESGGFEIQAYLPRPDADRERISAAGQFVSVDARPVSAARGTLKEIVALFKNRLSTASPQLGSVRDPFLCMNIACPPGSYDPNIEPAKDDVMFDDPEAVKAAVGRLLDSFYTVTRAGEAPNDADKNAISVDESRGQLPPMTSTHVDAAEREGYVEETEASDPPAKRRRIFRPNMYDCDEDDLHLAAGDELPAEPDEGEGTEQALYDITVSNPWTMVKMHAPVRTTNRVPTTNGQLLTPLRERTGSVLNTSPSSTSTDLPKGPVQMLLTPQASSPVRRSLHEGTSEDDVLRTSIQRLPPPPPWEPLHSSPVDRLPDQESSLLAARQTSPRPVRDFISARQLPLGTPLQAIPEAPSRTRRSAPRKQQHNDNKAFVPSVKNPSVVWFQNSSSPSRTQQPRAPPTRGHNLDIRDAFAALTHRVELHSSPTNARLASDDEVPIANTEKAVPAVTEAEQQARIPRQPRHRVTDGASDRPHRSKSALLPLERVPADSRMQNVTLDASNTTEDVLRSFKGIDVAANHVDWRLAPDASYHTFSQPPTAGELQDWSAKLQRFLQELYPDEHVERELRIELRPAFTMLQSVEPASSAS